MTLPTDAKGREEWPIYDYLYGYFPDAFMAEVQVSWEGNKQHNPGQKMHWARDKSSDHMNKAMRHLDDYGHGIKKDTDGCWHLAKAIWRLKARLQLDIEADRAASQPSTPVVPTGTTDTEAAKPAPTPGLADLLKDYHEKYPTPRDPWRRGPPIYGPASADWRERD